MSTTKLIQSIIHPLAKESIVPCSRHFCLCIEYLNFSTKKDVGRIYWVFSYIANYSIRKGVANLF